jgi:hypothetical protein
VGVEQRRLHARSGDDDTLTPGYRARGSDSTAEGATKIIASLALRYPVGLSHPIGFDGVANFDGRIETKLGRWRPAYDEWTVEVRPIDII